ncbi:polyprotein [Lagenaria siceraria endornavirus-California]|uniref:Polyprotein n=1 Tax=Lagenaria siceraria endornavirus-California TaxID=1468454 RepID=W8GTF9_9VIRU|nr:polyprotein [Lagenaria siceraria endornavirus-California]AHK22715.1 polyprotein [Lagenaria siceraria endornavirus-California]
MQYKTDAITPYRQKYKDRPLQTLNKEVSSHLQGWIRLPRNQSVTINKNPWIRSFEKLFKHKPDQIFDKNKMKLVPAIRGERKIRDTVGTVATNVTYDDGLGNVINFNELHPLDVVKILYNVNCLGIELWKSDCYSIQDFLTKVKHMELDDDEKDEEDFLDEDDLDDKLIVKMVKPGRGNCTNEILQVLDKILKRFGGFEGYYNYFLENHFKHFGYLEHKDDGSYDFHSVKFNPLKICGVCGRVNHYNQFNRGLRQVHYSLSHYKQKSKALKEDFLTEFDEHNKPINIPWRCGYCFTDLNYTVIVEKYILVKMIEYICNHLFVLQGDIEQLLKLGYGDIYDDLDIKDKEAIKSHDEIVVNNYFYHLQRKIITVGQDFDQASHKIINEVLGGCYFRPTSKLNSIKPEFIAELSTFSEIIERTLVGRDIACLGNVLPGTSRANIHNWFHNQTWFSKDPEVACSSEHICGHNKNYFIYGNLGLMGEPLHNVLNIVEAQRTLQFISPIMTTSRTLPDGTGMFQRTEDNLNFYLDGNPVPINFKTDTYNALNYYQIIKWGNKLYHVIEVKKLSLTRLMVIVGPFNETVDYPRLMVENERGIKIQIKLPDINSFMGGVKNLNYRPNIFELNVNLFRYLCMRNLNGKVSHDTLRSYAVGFSLRRFVVHNKVISNPTIAYEDLDMHIVLSRVCMMKLKNCFEISYNYSKALKFLGPFRSMIGDMESALTASVIGLMGEAMESTFGLKWETFMNVIDGARLQSMLQGISKQDFWEQLLQLTENIKTTPPRVLDLERKAEEELLFNLQSCMHHSVNCNHIHAKTENRCCCCNLPITTEIFCNCVNHNQVQTNLFHTEHYGREENVHEQQIVNTTTDKTLDTIANIIMLAMREPEVTARRAPRRVQTQQPKITTTELNQTQTGIDQLSLKSTKLDKEKETVDSPKSKASSFKSKTSSIKEPLAELDDWKRVLRRGREKPDDMANIILDNIMTSAEHITISIDNVEAINILGYDFVRHCCETVQYENDLNDGVNEVYYLPHLPIGSSTLPRDSFEVIDKVYIPNSGPMTCAFDAYHYSNDPGSLQEMIDILGAQPPFSTEHLGLYAKWRKDNIMVLTDNHVHVERYNETSNTFAVILFEHGETNADIGHFLPATIKRVKPTDVYYYHRDPNSIAERDHIIKKRYGAMYSSSCLPPWTPRDNLSCEIAYYNITVDVRVSEAMQPIKLEQIDGEWFLSNNPEIRQHLVEKEKIHAKLPKIFEKYISKIEYGLKLQLPVMEIEEFRHIDKELPDNYDKELESELLEILRVFARLSELTGPVKFRDIKQSHNGYLGSWFGKSKFHIPSGKTHKMKKMDVVMVRINNKFIKATIVGFDRNNPVLDYVAVCEQKATLIELKESMGSQIRELVGLCQSYIDMKTLKAKLAESKFLTGPAGFGKSTKIGQLAIPGDLCVAMTTSAVKALQAKVTKGVKVMTLEKALYSHSKTDQTLYVDEATMINWLFVGFLITESANIELFGAENQIGKRDMSKTPGIRYNITISDFIKPENKKVEHYTYRIGEPLATLLKSVEPKLTTRASHKTTYTITVLDPSLIENISNIIKERRPEVIITPYSYNRNLIEQCMKQERVPVVTTHAYQGVEVSRSMVVLKADAGNKWDLNGNPEYLNSALTRAKYHVDIIIYGNYTDVTSLEDIMTQVGGMDFDYLQYFDNTEESSSIIEQRQNQETLGEQRKEAQMQSKHLPENITINTMHELSEEMVNQLNELQISMQGAKLSYQKLNGGTSVTAQFAGSVISKVTNIEGVVTVEANPLIRGKIMQNLDTPIDIPELVKDHCDADSYSVECKMTLRQTNKIRELTWILDKTIDRESTRTINGTKIKMTKTASCPLFAGIVFETENEKLAISNGWYHITNRKITLNKEKFYPGLTPVIKWLQLNIKELILDSNNNIGWLQILKGDMAHFLWQLKEKSHANTLWLLNFLTESDSPKCYYNNIINTSKYNKAARSINQPMVSNHPSVADHQNYIIKKQKWLKNQEIYILTDGNQVILDVTTEEEGTKWEIFAVECMADMVKTGAGLQGIAAAELDIPGLMIPLHKHLALGTTVQTIINNNLLNLNKQTRPGVYDVVRLDKQNYGMHKHYLKSRFPRMTITTGNYEITNSGIELALEQILLNMRGGLTENSKGIVAYCGLCPISICMTGKYYIKIVLPDINSNIRYMYDMQKPQIDSMLDNFNAKRDAKTELYWDHETKCERILAGTGIYSLTIEEITKLLDKTECMYGWIPTHAKNTDEYIYDRQLNCYGYRGGRITNKVRNDIINKVNKGEPVLVRYDKSDYLEATIVTEVFNHRLIKLQYKPIPACNYIDRRLGTYMDINNVIKIKIPWIDLDLFRVLKDRQIVTIKELVINKRFLRNILLRLMTGDDTPHGALEYAKTLESTQVITEKGIDDLTASNLLITLNTTWYAIYIHNSYLEKFKTLIHYLNYTDGKPVAVLMLEQILTGIGNLMGVVSDKISEIAEQFITYLNRNYNLTNKMADCIKEAEKTNWTPETKQVYFNRFYFSKDEEFTLRSWLNWEDEPENEDEQFQDLDYEESENDPSIINVDPTSLPNVAYKTNETHSQEETLEEKLSSATTEATSSDTSSGSTTIMTICPEKPKKNTKIPIQVMRYIDEKGSTIISRKQTVKSIKKLQLYGDFDENQLVTAAQIIDKEYMEFKDLLDTPWNLKILSEKLEQALNVQLEQKYEELNPNTYQLKNYYKTKQDHFEVEFSEHFMVPKIIWFYWHSIEAPEFIIRCINSWATHNKDYRIVLLTSEDLDTIVPIDIKERIQNTTTTNLYLTGCELTYYLDNGGVWADASTICTGDIKEMMYKTIQSRTGLLQISLGNKNTKVKTSENWFIISSTYNQIMLMWNNLLTDLMCHTSASGERCSEWIKKKYPREFLEIAKTMASDSVDYLRSYILESIINQITGLYPENICRSEGQLTTFDSLPHSDWSKLLQIYFSKQQRPQLIIPLVKIIDSHRTMIMDELLDDPEIEEYSLLHDIYNTEITLNLTTLSDIMKSMEKLHRENFEDVKKEYELTKGLKVFKTEFAYGMSKLTSMLYDSLAVAEIQMIKPAIEFLVKSGCHLHLEKEDLIILSGVLIGKMKYMKDLREELQIWAVQEHISEVKQIELESWFETNEIKTMKLNVSTRLPTKPDYVIYNDRRIPKIIWSYWNNQEVEEFQIKMINNWHYHNQDYRIIILNEESLQKMVGKNTYNLLSKQTPQFRSDWVRLFVLSHFGGVWVDFSGLFVKSIHNLVESTVQNEAGYCQISLNKKEEKNIVLESWLIICTENCKVIQDWFEETKEMTKFVDPSGHNALEWMTQTYGTEYQVAKEFILPNLRIYLRIYIIQIIVRLRAKDEPLIVHSDEAEVSMFHKLSANAWMNLWDYVATQPKGSIEVSIPFIKWIGIQRDIIMSHYRQHKGTIRPASLLGEEMEYPGVNYNVTSSAELSYPIRESQSTKETTNIIINKYSSCRTLLICVGSVGDILQFKTLYDIAESEQQTPVIITHRDHEKFFKNKRSHYINVDSEELMSLVNIVLNEVDLWTDIKANHLVRQISEEITGIAKNYEQIVDKVVVNSAVPNLTELSDILPCDWLEVSTFPDDVVFNPKKKTGLKGAILKAKEWMHFNIIRSEVDRSKVRSLWRTCSGCPWFYPQMRSRCGPLTIWSSPSTSNEIKLDEQDLLITFGSCDNTIATKDKIQLIENFINCGYRVTYHDKYKIAIPGSTLFNTMELYPGKFGIIEQYDFRCIKGGKFTLLTHGGHGTIMEALATNCKIIIHPIIADQFQICFVMEAQRMAVRLNDITNLNDCKQAITNLNRLMDTARIIKPIIPLLFTPLCVWFQMEQRQDDPENAICVFGEGDIKELETELPYGIYKLLDVEHQIVYNPQVLTRCVTNSFESMLTKHGQEKYLTCNTIAAMKLQQHSVTEQELIDGILSMGLNITIIYSNGTALVIKPYKRTTVYFYIDKTKTPWHVSAAKLLRHGDQIQLLNPDTCIKDLPHSIEYEINELHKVYSCATLCIPKLMAQQFGKSFFKNFLARIRSTNLQVLSSRSDLHVTYISIKQHFDAWVGDTIYPDTPLGVGWVITAQGWVLVNYFVKDGIIVVFSDDGIFEQTVLINLHLQYPVKRSKPVVLSTKQELVSLNKPTIMYTTLNHCVPRSSNLVSNFHKQNTLIVADFDNRKHHMFDEMDMIKRAAKVIFHTNKQIKVEDLATSHNAPLNRMIIRQGKVLYEHEFEQNEAKTNSQIIRNYVVSEQQCITNSPLTEEQINYIHRYFIQSDNKLIAIDNENYNDKEVKPNDWVVTLIQNSEVMSQDVIQNLTKLVKEHSMWHIHDQHNYELTSTQAGDVVTLEHGDLWVKSYGIVLVYVRVGGQRERLSWKLDTSHQQTSNPKPGDWWGLEKKAQTKVSSSFKNVLAINELKYHEPETLLVDGSDAVESDDLLDMYIPPYHYGYTGSVIEPLLDFPDNIAMQLWEDTDQTDWLSLYAPSNQCQLKSRELPGKIIQTEKITLTKWPIRSRAVLTKVCFEEGRSILGRMKSVAFIRTTTPNPYKLVMDMADTYFIKGWVSKVNEFRAKRLVILPEDVKRWVETNKDAKRIEPELLELLSGEILVKPMNDVNIHLKLESLLKDNTTIMTKQQQARIIVWQRKAVCAIYSNLFVKVKDRLKSILHDKIIYADGLRPDEISARVRLCKDIAGFFENDLTKQDRQTDAPIITTEMYMYDLLGVHPNVIASWREMHEVWRFKSNHYWGQGQGMRLTGQATTAIGNCITNLQVHQEFVKKNFSILELALFLGDDMCMVFREKPDTKNLRKNIATKFNMQSKDAWYRNGATFCSMVMSRTPTGAELCPDVVRLKFRYEVTNGVHEANAENILMRKASYIMMLGEGPNVKETVTRLNLPIKPLIWYDFESMLRAVGDKYDMTHVQVLDVYYNLLQMINSEKLYRHTFRHFSNIEAK